MPTLHRGSARSVTPVHREPLLVLLDEVALNVAPEREGVLYRASKGATCGCGSYGFRVVELTRCSLTP